MTESESTLPERDAPRRDRLHGRRRGRKLRPGQQQLLTGLLPQVKLPLGELAAKGPRAIFPHDPQEVWLEIGFGGGEHAAYQAEANPVIGVIGCEVFEGGIVSMMGHIRDRSLTNLRVVTDDARLAVDELPDASIARAFVLFPDPWPKTRHHKRRIVSTETLDALARVLKDGAELRLGTDDVPYLRAMLACLLDHPEFDWLARRPEDFRVRPADWPQTRYEAKAIREGRAPAFLRFRRRERRAPHDEHP